MGQAGYGIRYDFTVSGNQVNVTRNGQPIETTFSTTEKDTASSPSALHRFLVSIGRPHPDAHMVCEAIEKGQSVSSVFGNK